MARRGPRPAHDRLRRLLVMLPWLMERGEVSIAEMADHFSLTESELVADLELVAMCGLPPFIDELIDVFIDDGRVFAGVPRVFTRPLRLTAPEGFALLAAGRAAMALPGADPAGPLGRALDKLAATLGDVGVVIDLERPPIADVMAAAASTAERVRITYWTPARDEAATREITPRAVFADSGHWYVVADDQRSHEQRSFRLDRILDSEATGVFDAVRETIIPDPERWFADERDIERATLRLPTEMAWMVERYPLDSLEADARHDDMMVAVLPVASEQWLARLMLRLGDRAEVIEPQRWTKLGAETARAVLARYETTTSES